ncbi:MAG: outer membrane protein assembly factor BamB family protein, partial [Planctomycetota bacterium]
NQNPLFVLSAVDLEKGDYHLLPDSPCVNAGEPELVDSDKLDMDGQSRLLGGRIDIGADEVLSQIYVSTPTGGEVWASGSTHEIKWMSNAVSTVDVVDILLSVNGGTDWQTIGTGIPNTGSKIWSLPEMIDSNNCRILVVPGISDSNIICTESNVFTIRPYSPGVAVESKWESLGGNFARTGLSDSNGPESGCIKWQFETTMAVSASVTVGLDNTVYIPCEDGKLYAIDPNGSLIWNYDANTPLISSPTLGPDSTVYVGGMNGKLYAVDINGNLLWTHSTGGFIYSSPAVSTESKIYVGSQDGVLYALDRDGSELWRFETKGPGKIQMGSIFASPAIGADETVYIAGLYDPNLYALDPADGSIKWTCNFESQGWPFASPVIADDGTIYQTLLYSILTIFRTMEMRMAGQNRH